MVGLGGFAGSVCRYLVGLLPVGANEGFPYKTLAINVVGAFFLGLICAWAAKNSNLSPRMVLMLRVGVCGGFTTFSTFAFEALELLRGGRPAAAAAYVLASMALGVLAVFAGDCLIRG